MTVFKLVETINMVHTLRNVIDPRATLNKIVVFLHVIRDEHTTLKELEQCLDIERSVVNKIISSLVQSGLVSLTTEHVDVRRKRVHLTTKGTALAHRLFNIETPQDDET